MAGPNRAIIPAVTAPCPASPTLVDANSGFSVPRRSPWAGCCKITASVTMRNKLPWWEPEATAQVAPRWTLT